MCGIWAYVLDDSHSFSTEDVATHEKYISTLSKRGPDRYKDACYTRFRLAFHRLAINDTSPDGDQPFVVIDNDGNVIHYICNGEIYNYESIVSRYDLEVRGKLTSNSDCEVLGYLFSEYWDTPDIILSSIVGEFAFVAVRVTPSGERSVLAARDPFGVRPLYWSTSSQGVLFSSLLSGIVGLSDAKAYHFPPGHYVTFSCNTMDMRREMYHVNEYTPKHVTNDEIDTYYSILVTELINAVQRRLTSDRDIGFLLSGGLDSSLVVAIAVHILGVKRPKTFSIGMEGSSDLIYARQVATHLGTDHTEVIFTHDDAVAAIPEVVACLETYDITTIRASIGSFLLAKYISQNTNVRVILNGDGSDEVACGYLYNYYAPSPDAAHTDAKRLLSEIHMYDGLRVDRTLSHHGLEARLPFLDPYYVRTYLEIPPEFRIPTHDSMEKNLLRKAFDISYPDILPHEVLFRRKEAFSDGVSSKVGTDKETLIMRIKAYAASQGTTEHEMYKALFENQFPDHLHVIPKYWMPQWTDATDPSATSLAIYRSAEPTLLTIEEADESKVDTSSNEDTANEEETIVEEEPTLATAAATAANEDIIVVIDEIVDVVEEIVDVTPTAVAAAATDVVEGAPTAVEEAVDAIEEAVEGAVDAVDAAEVAPIPADTQPSTHVKSGSGGMLKQFKSFLAYLYTYVCPTKPE